MPGRRGFASRQPDSKNRLGASFSGTFCTPRTTKTRSGSEPLPGIAFTRFLCKQLPSFMSFVSFLKSRLCPGAAAGLVFLAAAGAELLAQNPTPATDGFAPSPNGIVTTLAVQPDGKILMGGYFTQLQPPGSPVIAANHIARVNHDGSIDGTFNPSIDDVVRTVALAPNGQILVGGQFLNVQGSGGGIKAALSYAARLNADGSLDSTFNPQP